MLIPHSFLLPGIASARPPSFTVAVVLVLIWPPRGKETALTHILSSVRDSINFDCSQIIIRLFLVFYSLIKLD